MLRVSAAIISAAYAISLEKNHQATTKPAPGTIKPMLVDQDQAEKGEPSLMTDYDEWEPEPQYATCGELINALQEAVDAYEGSATQELDDLYADILEEWNNR